MAQKTLNMGDEITVAHSHQGVWVDPNGGTVVTGTPSKVKLTRSVLKAMKDGAISLVDDDGKTLLKKDSFMLVEAGKEQPSENIAVDNSADELAKLKEDYTNLEKERDGLLKKGKSHAEDYKELDDKFKKAEKEGKEDKKEIDRLTKELDAEKGKLKKANDKIAELNDKLLDGDADKGKGK